MDRVELQSRYDGFAFSAYRQRPPDARRGGLIVIQEIFGVSKHIRETAEGFSAEGFETLAPSLYDRQDLLFESSYEGADVRRARQMSEAAQWEEVGGDLAACVAALAPPVFAVGYCWGGAAAWMAACRVDGLTAASCYYGRRIPEFAGETPKCPVIAHFGRKDASIPPEVVEAITEANPDVPVFVYDAGHGFASDRRPDYDEDSARLAHLRTLQLFSRVGGRGEF